MKLRFAFSSCVFLLHCGILQIRGGPIPGYLGYQVNHVNLDNTFLVKPNGYDYSINYPEYPLYHGIFRQDAPTFHRVKPQYPTHLYPYQAVFFVSTAGISPPGSIDHPFHSRQDAPDVDLPEYGQSGPNLYTVDAAQPKDVVPAVVRDAGFLHRLPPQESHVYDETVVIPEGQEHFDSDLPGPAGNVQVQSEFDHPEIPPLDLNPFRLPLMDTPVRAEDEPATTGNVPVPIIDLNREVEKIPLSAVGNDEEVVKSTFDEANPQKAEEKVKEDAVVVPSTDMFDDVHKIKISPVSTDEVGVASKLEVKSEVSDQDQVELMVATTESVMQSSDEAVGNTESPVGVTETNISA